MTDYQNTMEVYETLCKFFDEHNLNYTKDDEQPSVSIGFKGNKYPLQFVIILDKEREVIAYHSIFPFTIEKDHLVEAAIAACAINFRLINGCFSVDLSDGTLDFSITSCYRECAVSQELLQDFFDLAFDTVKDYNEAFAAIGSGELSLDDFLKSLEG